LAWLQEKQISPALIPPRLPWKNGFVESFHDKFRDECLDREWLLTIPEARVVAEAWRKEYNTERPHSSLEYLTPAAFAAKQANQTDATLTPNGHNK